MQRHLPHGDVDGLCAARTGYSGPGPLKGADRQATQLSGRAEANCIQGQQPLAVAVGRRLSIS